MARPKVPADTRMAVEQVSGNPVGKFSIGSPAAVYRQNRRPVDPRADRTEIAKRWQVEAYRHLNICGEARYAANLFASIAGRAEIGVSEPQALSRKAVWVAEGEEVEAFAELAPTVRERSKLIRDYMLHRIVAGECYLIARERQEHDPEYETRRDDPVWEIVAVTELQKTGDRWEVRYENSTFIPLREDDPVVRMWVPDPENRREAWSPFRSLLPTLVEIEYLTKHIFTQVRSRLISAGIWFIPNNLTYPTPPASAVDGGAEAIATMNEAEQFMHTLAASSMEMLEPEEVAMPTVVMADPDALSMVSKDKLIEFWSEIDDKAMILRSDAVRRFSLGMDLPPEQVLGSSGLAVTGAGGSAGSVNHWGVWANEEQTISSHVEPALDDFAATLTSAYLRSVVPGTELVVGYDTATLRLRQDRSKEAMEWYDRGVLKAEVALRETGFDPDSDRMDDKEFKRWLLTKIAGGSATPEQVQESLRLLGVVLNVAPGPSAVEAPRQPGRNNAPSLEDHPYEGPPRVQNDQSDAPFGVFTAACEGLTLRALERAGNRLLNSGKRGKDRDRTTPPYAAHVLTPVEEVPEFDFSTASVVLSDLTAREQAEVRLALQNFCKTLYETQTGYTRDGLVAALGGFK